MKKQIFPHVEWCLGTAACLIHPINVISVFSPHHFFFSLFNFQSMNEASKETTMSHTLLRRWGVTPATNFSYKGQCTECMCSYSLGTLPIPVCRPIFLASITMLQFFFLHAQRVANLDTTFRCCVARHGQEVI